MKGWITGLENLNYFTLSYIYIYHSGRKRGWKRGNTNRPLTWSRCTFIFILQTYCMNTNTENNFLYLHTLYLQSCSCSTDIMWLLTWHLLEIKQNTKSNQVLFGTTEGEACWYIWPLLAINNELASHIFRYRVTTEHPLCFLLLF